MKAEPLGQVLEQPPSRPTAGTAVVPVSRPQRQQDATEQQTSGARAGDGDAHTQRPWRAAAPPERGRGTWRAA